VAYIREYKSKKNSRLYSARWKLANGKEGEARGFRTRKEAKNHAEEMEAFERKIRKNQAKRIPGPITLREFVESTYLGSLEVADSTKENYATIINAHILPRFGSTPIRSIKPADIKKWRNELRDKKSGRGTQLKEDYVDKIANHLGMILTVAVDNEFLDASPSKKVKRKKMKQPKAKIVPLTYEQTKAIAMSMSERFRLIVWIGYYTGMRPSEALGLTWDRINFKNNRIKIDRQLSRSMDRVFAKSLKTSASYREIHLAVQLKEILIAYQAKFGLAPEGLLIKNRLGGVWRYKDASDRFRRAARLHGVPVGVGLHVLRHTCVSNLIKGGRTAKEIQHWVGHDSIVETMDTYGHLFPDHLAMVGTEIDKIFDDVSAKSDNSFTTVA